MSEYDPGIPAWAQHCIRPLVADLDAWDPQTRERMWHALSNAAQAEARLAVLEQKINRHLWRVAQLSAIDQFRFRWIAQLAAWQIVLRLFIVRHMRRVIFRERAQRVTDALADVRRRETDDVAM